MIPLNLERFGEMIRQGRLNRYWTQDYVGTQVNCAGNYISMLERAAPRVRDGSPSQPRVELVDDLAELFHFNAQEHDDLRVAAGHPRRGDEKPDIILAQQLSRELAPLSPGQRKRAEEFLVQAAQTFRSMAVAEAA